MRCRARLGEMGTPPVLGGRRCLNNSAPSQRMNLVTASEMFLGRDLRHKVPPTILHCMATAESRRTQMLRGVLDLCLLAVMEEGAAYGYEMTKRLRARGLSIVGEGSIYPLLGRLERDGLVETRRQASNGGPPRKYYSLSLEGKRALEMGIDEWKAARDAIDGALDLANMEVAP
jgi:PadR family transcriptional regulator PadR